jgi:putative NADPH-quinone reductase
VAGKKNRHAEETAMTRHIVIIQGHPDSSKPHYCHALAEAYASGAAEAGHEVRIINVAEVDFPLLHTYEEFYEQDAPSIIQPCQDDVRWAEHIVIVYPLWMGDMPALLKGFFEQLFRPGFAMQPDEDGKSFTKLLKGKSARIIVTMGMPAFFYRWYFRAHSLKSLENNILKFSGIKPVHESLVGLVEGSPGHRQRWLKKMAILGKAGN